MMASMGKKGKNENIENGKTYGFRGKMSSNLSYRLISWRPILHPLLSKCKSHQSQKSNSCQLQQNECANVGLEEIAKVKYISKINVDQTFTHSAPIRAIKQICQDIPCEGMETCINGNLVIVGIDPHLDASQEKLLFHLQIKLDNIASK